MMAVFDLRPANGLTTQSGLMVASDSIPVRLTPSARASKICGMGNLWLIYRSPHDSRFHKTCRTRV